MRETKCDRCGVRPRERKATLQEPYPYRMSGLKSVFLAGIVVRKCPGCGTESPIIRKIGQLHEAIASDLLMKPALLEGDELRFLRKNAGIAARDFAALLGVDPAHLSRVENGHTKNLGTSADRLARAIVSVVMEQPIQLRLLLLDVAKKIGMRRRARRPTFKLDNDRWRLSAA